MTDEERIAKYHAERDKALESLREIDSGEFIFSLARGQNPPEDVTAVRRAEKQRIATMMDEAANAWQRRVEVADDSKNIG